MWDEHHFKNVIVMDNPNNQTQDSEYAKILEMTGIQEGSSDVQTIDLNEPQAEDKPKEEPKEEEAKAEEAKVEPKSEEKPAEEKKPENAREHVRSKRSGEDSAIKAVFTQLGEIQRELATLKKSATPEEKPIVKTLDDTVKEIAEKRNLDAEGLAEIIELAKSQVVKDMEEKGLLKKDLDPTILEKLKVLDKIQEEQAAREETINDEQEWMSVLPSLQKQYPNAPANLFAEAKKVLLEAAHTKEMHDKDIDYVVFKNMSKLDAILKVAKANKSGESASKEFRNEEQAEEKEIDLDPENITPEKMKRYERQKYGLSEDITIMG